MGINLKNGDVISRSSIGFNLADVTEIKDEGEQIKNTSIRSNKNMHIFKDNQHKEFYEKHINKTNSQNDPYRKALFYALGLTEQTQKHINNLYNFEEDCIEWDGLKEPWQTSTSVRVCRLAFNLYNGLHGEQDEKERAVNYTPKEIFNCGLIEYMFEAVRIRFEKETEGNYE